MRGYRTIYVAASEDKQKVIHAAIKELLKQLEEGGEIKDADWDISDLKERSN